MRPLLIIGMNPYTLDFSKPGFPPGMTAEQVLNGIRSEQENLAALGYKLETYLPDFGNLNMDALITMLQNKAYEGIIIGAGIRIPPSCFTLFEHYINIVHEYAPQAKIMFNTRPDDNVAAVQRWF